MRSERLETGGARAMAHERPAAHPGSGIGDLRIGDAQEHRAGAAAIRAPAQRSLNVAAGGAKRARQRSAETAIADDGEASMRAGRGNGAARAGRAAREARRGIPFQFPHLRYRSAVREVMRGE